MIKDKKGSENLFAENLDANHLSRIAGAQEEKDVVAIQHNFPDEYLLAVLVKDQKNEEP